MYVAMYPNKKRGLDSSEESSKKKGKAVVAEDQQKGLYDDLVEESVEVAFSTEQGVLHLGFATKKTNS